MDTNICRYFDCVNAKLDCSNVCPHDVGEDCPCSITCAVCREWMGLPKQHELTHAQEESIHTDRLLMPEFK